MLRAIFGGASVRGSSSRSFSARGKVVADELRERRGQRDRHGAAPPRPTRRSGATWSGTSAPCRATTASAIVGSSAAASGGGGGIFGRDDAIDRRRRRRRGPAGCEEAKSGLVAPSKWAASISFFHQRLLQLLLAVCGWWRSPPWPRKSRLSSDPISGVRAGGVPPRHHQKPSRPGSPPTTWAAPKAMRFTARVLGILLTSVSRASRPC